MFTIESLYHFNCSYCKKWFSIGDSAKRELFCPWCGYIELHTFLDSISGSYTPRSEKELYDIGELVEKFTGDYKIRGEIVALFKKKSGVKRAVIETKEGLLLIFNLEQIRKANES